MDVKRIEILKVVNIKHLTVGMTVRVGGKNLTVDKNSLRYDPFLGYSFNGASHPREILTVTWLVPTKDGYRKA